MNITAHHIDQARQIVASREMFRPSEVALAIRILRQWSPDDLVPGDLPADVIPFRQMRRPRVQVLDGDGPSAA